MRRVAGEEELAFWFTESIKTFFYTNEQLDEHISISGDIGINLSIEEEG
jgi:hypothetical protein